MFCCSPERKGTDKTMKKMLSMTLSKVYASHSNTGLHSFPMQKLQENLSRSKKRKGTYTPFVLLLPERTNRRTARIDRNVISYSLN
uniref:Uncharacterized protein MANES_14G086600 n=1 Tax=Rhizophora mucronata TaxID=61149 RepID=A0A2P2JC37_RHIMU